MQSSTSVESVVLFCGGQVVPAEQKTSLHQFAVRTFTDHLGISGPWVKLSKSLRFQDFQGCLSPVVPVDPVVQHFKRSVP